MNFRNILAAAVFAAVSAGAFAQSPAEMSVARQMARQYGYTEREIDAIAGHNITGQTVQVINQAAPDVVAPVTSTVVDPAVEEANTVVVTPAVPQTDAGAEDTGIYGHSYFHSTGLGIIPSYNAPAPASYVLGPGDEVIVDIWGSTVSHVTATIGNDGSIVMADLGPVYIGGLSLSRAEASLKAQLSRIYSGLSDGNGDTFLTLSVGRIKGVVVNVSGEVPVPGAYTIPSLTAIPSAIYMAGGITDNASVRDITLFRKGRKVAEFDLYEFIFNGTVNDNLRLQDGDVIYVPAYTSVVKITGAVARPQKYEMRQGETVSDLLRYASGFTGRARRDEVNVTRFETSDGVSTDVKAAQFGSFALKDGDLVNVRSFVNIYSNRVAVTGPVLYPGSYALEGSVSDVAGLIRAAGGLVEGAYTSRGQIRRIDHNHTPKFVSFNLRDVMDGKVTVPLFREDSVILFTEEAFLPYHEVTVSGHVKNPGVFPFREGMTVADLILLADGVLEDPFGQRGQISRISRDGLSILVPFSVQDVMDGKSNVMLERSDEVRIYGLRELIQDATISVNGEVGAPGTFGYYEGATLADALMLAGGCTNGADFSNIQIAGRGGRERGTVEVYDLEADPSLADTPLKPYDVISVRKLTYFRPQVTVTVNGEVRSPGTYVVNKAEVRLSDVMRQVGGFTDAAYIHGSSLTRHLTEEELERQELAYKIAAQNTMTEDEDGNKLSSIDSTFILRDSYVIGIDMVEALRHPGSDEDVVLRAGDVINVPQLNNTVKVSGAVFYPNTLAYAKGRSWRSYVREAGGFANNAKKNKTYAVCMNGKVYTRGDISVEPGMEIVVPEKVIDSERRRISPAEIAALATASTSLVTLIVSLIRIL